MNDILIITGPTASGKSKICLEIARNHRCVIINCDSKQIYQGVPIITDQPASNQYVDYKLYGYVLPTYNYSVGLWLQDVKEQILHAWNQNLLPIITGGTGMYINSLINGLSPIPSINPEIRYKTKKLFETLGREEFYKLLIKKDQLASNLHPNNTHKILRAFEVIEQTKVSIFTWQKNKHYPLFNKYHVHIILPNREQLYKKINQRFINMINTTAIKEVEYLLSLNLSYDLPIMKAHGVPEIIQYLNGKISLSQAIEISQKNTRQYAKRQYTWFKNQLPNAMFFDDHNKLIEYVMSSIGANINKNISYINI
ncbi:tRNA (adenosine(37)-N6)-dimethylallyltransferase MiaA [Neoehrlichia mikurensis]|uniref:tRNA dimethylallyltransferase n=1 Tax=Neoehrlichia mikurensis TaxID=89586 RepID=A0A9Q9BUD6_9RICK|nr:tRNA (adenosine(37)-N6)-dimethylallyltransferase MiaA [Neoehrlichia mikurensis]QXK92003.1 tRNA (adenosine(37)-N6)-dimethylallyltransferase MiaA [Neoehrlichia mikurensis]QXK92460.1 tRNA (adenosine(37)-N6)-dimethylallyltransferase MiaA [Neoehrlichia mikurensis]QXK93696.1 tRNA (adenosine(37)-N6)-dimethylallyltransferase MiaA [Neoehrlichia mikurensis]UTO55331.1 tRNA (adenosine(37)-N6)-dimethylallyltransferase MiaA [Neoehrlichia mikurensis]UTO56252.1 tRNA (adenosine(37)-N6)-dimethylallyltransfer